MRLLKALLKPFKKVNRLSSKQDIKKVIELNRKQLKIIGTQVKEEMNQTYEGKSISESSPINQKEIAELTTLPGIGPKTAKLLIASGFTTKSRVLKAEESELLKIKGISKVVISKLKKQI